MSDRTYVDLFEFKTDGDHTNVDIVTIEQRGERKFSDFSSYLT